MMNDLGVWGKRMRRRKRSMMKELGMGEKRMRRRRSMINDLGVGGRECAGEFVS